MNDDAYLFDSFTEVNAIVYEWQIDYDENHLHTAPNGQSLWFYAKESLVS